MQNLFKGTNGKVSFKVPCENRLIVTHPFAFKQTYALLYNKARENKIAIFQRNQNIRLSMLIRKPLNIQIFV